MKKLTIAVTASLLSFAAMAGGGVGTEGTGVFARIAKMLSAMFL